MIIAGIRPPDPAEVARQLRERMARADAVGEPRSGHHPLGDGQQLDQESTDAPPVQEHHAAN